MFHDPHDAKTYTLAGRATVTLTSERTGTRYTYKVRQMKDEGGQPRQLWSVGLLTGPDNESDYQYVGVLNGELKLTAKSRLKDDSVPVRAFRWFWRHVSEGQMPPETEVRHAGTCGRCGRTLTVPESVDSGLGPECRTKM